MRNVDATDQALLELLAANSRLSVTDLARQLGLSRVTVQERMRRLEQRGVIRGYTIRFNPDYLESVVTAHILISIDQKKAAQLYRQLEKMPTVRSLYSISGEYDFCAVVREESTAALDRQIDRMAELDGVLRTLTSVVLSKKFEK